MSRNLEIRIKQGFTLPELLIVLLLLSLLSSLLLRCFMTVSTQQEQQLALLELEDNLAIAQAWFRDDITQSSAVLDCAAEQLTLRQKQIVSYTLGNDQQKTEHLYPLEGKILYRKESTQWNRQPMANFIETLTISYYNAQGNPTTEPVAVCAVGVQLTGCWRDRQITKQQIVKLQGDGYL